MKLSVIIPVYRVEATLDRCIESVVGQTFDDMEIILVDDGSPDRCPALCDAWGERDSRIRVIHKANGGLSDARNAALDVAQGEYVTFVDSDDFLDRSTYTSVMAKTAENDITEFGFYRFYGSPWQKEILFSDQTFSTPRDYWLRCLAYEHCYAWNKIYRRSLFDGVRFPVGLVFEDVFTLPLLLARARHIATVANGLYYYCHNAQGITATAQGRQLQMLLDAHQKAMTLWCDDRYYMHILNIQADTYEHTGKAPSLPFRHVNPFTAGLTPSQRMKALALFVLGVERICKLNKTLHQWKTPSHS